MKKTGLVGAVLEVEDVLDFPYTSFDETCQSVLEAAVKILKGQRGMLLLVNEREELEEEAIYAAGEMKTYSEKEKSQIESLARTLLDSNRDHCGQGEGLEPLADFNWTNSHVCMRLKKKARGQKVGGSERRQFAFEELTKFIGVIFIERKASEESFSTEHLSSLESYLPYATNQLFQAKVYELAALDSLTHFFTRSQLEHLLRAEIKLSEKFSSPMSLLMLDIEGFKEVNREFGEDGGDAVLKEFAALISQTIRKEDTAVRYGGDEIILLLPGTGEQGAKILARKLQRKVEDTRFLANKVKLGITMGIAVYPYHGKDPDKLIKRTDEALTAAKEGGMNLAIWDKDIDPSHHSDRLLGIITGDPAKDYRNVMMLLDTIVAVNSTLDYKHLLSIIVDMMIEMTHSDRCFLITYDGDGNIQKILGQDKEGREIKGQGYLEEVVDRVRRSGMPHSEEDLASEVPELFELMKSQGIESLMCVPLSVRDKVIGVVYVDSREKTKEFSHQDKIFFYALSREIGIAVENARLYEENLKAKKKVEELNKKLQKQVEKQAHELEEVKGTLDANLRELKQKYTYSNIVGTSKALQDIFSLLDRVTESDVPVLVQGESGTGKELVSKAIHYNGPRKSRRFVSLNCAALSDSLLESELFGYVKGAFTGADQDRKGLFERAHKGTLFLDEVGDMSLKMQKELLRVLQEGEVRPVGGKDIINVNVRIICATNRNLKERIEEGKFREDLYYRINVVQLRLPPLRERKEDILPLAEKFLRDFAKESGKKEKRLTSEAVNYLMNYNWPGNIRELKNVIERTALLCSSEVITADDIILDMDRAPTSQQEHNHLFELEYKEAKDEFIRQYVRAKLEKNDDNVTNAAKDAGIHRSFLHKMINKYDV